MKDLTDMKLYYLNLDTREDRRAHFESQDALVAMPPVERIPAVHGSKINMKKDKKIGVHTRVQLTTSYRRSHYEIHSPGAVGASLSHIKAWKKFLADGGEYALIMEDDVNLPSTFAFIVRDCIKDLPAEWDIWILGWNNDPSDMIHKRHEPFRNVVHFIGAHCYVVSKRAAKILVDEAFPIETHIEHYMSNVALLHGLKIIRNLSIHMSQVDRELNISDIRKPEGCIACSVDDREADVAARRANM